MESTAYVLNPTYALVKKDSMVKIATSVKRPISVSRALARFQASAFVYLVGRVLFVIKVSTNLKKT